MTLAEAKKLKWGTKLQPTKTQRDMSRWRYLRDGIFLGVSKDGQNISVIVNGRKTVTHWAPVFWKTKPEVL